MTSAARILALCGVFGALAAVAASRIYDPFAGDQALFLIGAEKLHAGGALYRDFWDLKQPGIYDFFLVGGAIFGFTQIGEHLADMVWQLAFAATLATAFWSVMRYRLVALFASLAVVGSYYAGSSSWHLMQVEGLIGLPLFCSTWAAIAATRTERSRARLLLASGCAAGIVIIFKAFLGVVAVVIVASVLASSERRGWRAGAKDGAAWFAGASIPLAAIVAGMIADGTLETALHTTFVLPLQIVTTVAHAPFARLDDSAMRLLLYFRGIILLGLVGLVADRNARSRPWRIACAAWLLGGTGVLLAQVESWWQYHALLLVPPIGILSAFGFDVLLSRVMRGRWTTVAALAAAGIVAYVAVPLPQGAIGTLLRVARERPFASEASLERYRIATSSEYAISSADAAALEAAPPAHGSLYVFGEPLIYLISGREQGIAMNGWAPQINTSALWGDTYDELAAARPQDVFVNGDVAGYLARARGGAIATFLREKYDERQRTSDGIWYALRRGSARPIAPSRRRGRELAHTRSTLRTRRRGAAAFSPRDARTPGPACPPPRGSRLFRAGRRSSSGRPSP